MTTSTTTQNTEAPVEQTLLRLATLYRQSGNSLLGGRGVLAVGDLIRVVAGPDPGNALLAIGWFLQAVGALLALLGIPGLYSRIVAGTCLLCVAGLTGITIFLFYFGIFGGMLHALAVPDLVHQVASRPIPVDRGFFAAAVIVMIGSLALGIGVLRARVLSLAAAALIIAGGLALFVGHPIMYAEDIGLLLLTVGLGWAGFGVRAVWRV